MRERVDCPDCEDATLRPIIYVLVTDEELQEKADRGAVVDRYKGQLYDLSKLPNIV